MIILNSSNVVLISQSGAVASGPGCCSECPCLPETMTVTISGVTFQCVDVDSNSFTFDGVSNINQAQVVTNPYGLNHWSKFIDTTGMGWGFCGEPAEIGLTECLLQIDCSEDSLTINLGVFTNSGYQGNIQGTGPSSNGITIHLNNNITSPAYFGTAGTATVSW